MHCEAARLPSVKELPPLPSVGLRQGKLVSSLSDNRPRSPEASDLPPQRGGGGGGRTQASQNPILIENRKKKIALAKHAR